VNPILAARAAGETEWINRVIEHANGNFAMFKWRSKDIKGDSLLSL